MKRFVSVLSHKDFHVKMKLRDPPSPTARHARTHAHTRARTHRVIVMALAQEATERDDDNDNPDLDDFHKKVSKKVRKVLENARDPKHPVILAETQLGVNPP